MKKVNGPKKSIKMKKILISIFLLAVASSYSQELNLPVYTQYLADNNFVVSPTFAGIGDNLRIRANGLTQWVGIKDAPQNQSLYVDFRIADQSGIGISLYNDKNGFTKQTGAKLSFAHHIILDYYSKQYMSFGISYNINNFKLDPTGLSTGDLEPLFLSPKNVSNNNFDVGILYRKANFYVSFNASNVLDKNLDLFAKVEPNLLRNYQIYTGYIIPTSGRAEIEPSVYYQLFQSDGRSSTDINIKYRKFDRYEDYYWFGASYRFLNDQALKPLNIGPMAGFKKLGFYFGYSYQVTLNELARFNSGIHVVTIGFDFLQGISVCPCTQSPVHE
jgi:type IX secretion system PorP/SprF family membrane protein